MSGSSLNSYSTSKGAPLCSLGIRVMRTVSGRAGGGGAVTVNDTDIVWNGWPWPPRRVWAAALNS